MLNVCPFRAIVPAAQKAAEVSCPPYDVLTFSEAAKLAGESPESFVRVSRPEVDLGPDGEPGSDSAYHRARDNYAALRRTIPFSQENEPTFYAYALETAGHSQSGIAATAAIDDYESGVIRRHERTKPDKVEDRARHIAALRAQTGPVLLAYRDAPEIDRIVGEATSLACLFDFSARDGVRHRVWRVPAPLRDDLHRAFREVPYAYVADGHHRAESASRVRAILRQRNVHHDGQEEYNRFLAVLFPASQLRILPYNRAVHGLNGHTPAELLEQLGQRFCLEPTDSPQPRGRGVFGLYLASKWWSLTLAGGANAARTAAESLDASLLQDLVLGPLLGIEDPRTSQRIRFVGGDRGTDGLRAMVDSAEADVAFSLYPTTMDDVMAVSDAGEIMPPKSTWFEPKLRDGLLVHEI